ncbi:MAG: polysaccharide deacetylase family protein [Solirubrobacteraceae bacterium]
MPRILQVLAREQLSATFFAPGQTIDTYPALCRRILEEGHGVAHHGYFHESPADLDESPSGRAHARPTVCTTTRCHIEYDSAMVASPWTGVVLDEGWAVGRAALADRATPRARPLSRRTRARSDRPCAALARVLR